MSNPRDEPSGLAGQSIGVSDLFSQELDIPHHDTYERHEFGKAFPLPTMPAPLGQTAKVGNSLAPARADHVHSIGATATRNAFLYHAPGASPPAVPANDTAWHRMTDVAITIGPVTYTRFVNVNARAAFVISGAASKWVGLRVEYTSDGGGLWRVCSGHPNLFNPPHVVWTALGDAALEFNEWMQVSPSLTYTFQMSVLMSTPATLSVQTNSPMMNIMAFPQAAVAFS